MDEIAGDTKSEPQLSPQRVVEGPDQIGIETNPQTAVKHEPQSGQAHVLPGEDQVESGITGALVCRKFPCTSAHIGFTLVSCAFVLFEFLFVTMFSEQFWFGIDIRWLGIPAVLTCMLVAHFVLKFQESGAVCNFVSPIWKQKPPILYSRCLTLNDPQFAPGVRVGNKNLQWQAIDELELSLLGNLIFKSFALTGRADASSASKTGRKSVKPDVVLKIPFAVMSFDDQDELISLIRQMQPNVVLNKRLRKRLETKEVRGGGLVQLLGTGFMFLVLIDVGFSTFSYLETLKQFYLAQVSAISGTMGDATKEYNSAMDIMNNPVPISWVTSKLMSQEPVGPGLYQAQSDALWQMGKREEALQASQRAAAISKKSFRANLKLARMLASMHRDKDAAEQLDQAKQNHKDSFLPQLYMVALRQGDVAPVINGKARVAFDVYRKELDEDLFADEPHWPPGGNRFLHDVWYSDDVDFVFGHLIDPKSIHSNDPKH